MNYPIKTESVKYIKLGKAGGNSEDCIENGYIQIDFFGFTHEELSKGDYEAIRTEYLKRGTSSSWASIYANQIEAFYTLNKNTLWVTFYNQKLYYGFAESTVYEANNFKRRSIIGGWRSTDKNGDELLKSSLSTAFTKVTGFRSTICNVYERVYLLRRINASQFPEMIAVEKNLEELYSNIGKLVQLLREEDFEILVDLILRGQGYNRIGKIGGTQSLKDIELFDPINETNLMVQVKSETSVKETKSYIKKFRKLKNYDKVLYVAHTGLDKAKFDTEDDFIDFWSVEEIAINVVKNNLIVWVMTKVK